MKPIVLLWHSGTEKLFGACQYTQRDDQLLKNLWEVLGLSEKKEKQELPSQVDIKNFWRIQKSILSQFSGHISYILISYYRFSI